MVLSWDEVARKSPLCLNLGGGDNAHPKRHYEQFVSVDRSPEAADVWVVAHDLTKPFPLADACVDKIHTEDFLEHIPQDRIVPLLDECYRVLKPKARMRVGVPDYNNPKDRFCLELGHDPRNRSHVTLTRHELVHDLIAQSRFRQGQFYHYWSGGSFVMQPIDYSLGMVKRTPDNDPRCRRTRFTRKLQGRWNDFWYQAVRFFSYDQAEFLARKGHRLYVTSLVVDLVKLP